MYRLHRLAGLILLLGTVACNSSPTGPSSQAGALISGTVSSQVPADMRVSAGAASSVPVEPTGTFTLNNVPPGPTELRFTTAGTTASLPLSALRSNETITLTVSVNGASAIVESLRRVYGLAEEVEGQIQSLETSTMLVAGRSISMGASTQFTAGGQPALSTSLGIGQRVNVKGQANGASLLASVVDMHGASPVAPQPVSLTGQISSWTGTAPDLVLIISGQTVRITAATQVRRKGESQLTNTIATGQTVEVTGTTQAGTLVATILNIVLDSPGGGFAMEGTIQDQSGSCPQLQLVVSSYAVSADAATTFETNCSDLAVGDRIMIVGIVQPDMSVVATRIREK